MPGAVIKFSYFLGYVRTVSMRLSDITADTMVFTVQSTGSWTEILFKSHTRALSNAMHEGCFSPTHEFSGDTLYNNKFKPTDFYHAQYKTASWNDDVNPSCVYQFFLEVPAFFKKNQKGNAINIAMLLTNQR